jgi:hypothetical protein
MCVLTRNFCARRIGAADQDGSVPVADILVRCPSTGAAVATGLKTEWVLLRSLPAISIPLRCPACGQLHKWQAQDAWIGSASLRPPLGRAGLPENCETVLGHER